MKDQTGRTDLDFIAIGEFAWGTCRSSLFS
jgi:hypothetical protein